MVAQTLDEMARGGMYDQLGGGFHRYSVDERWLVPHFEKMLYDNALLARAYLEALPGDGRPVLRARRPRDVLDYVLREMTSPEGGFYSATDADTEGEEGKFFVWTAGEMREALAARTHDASSPGSTRRPRQLRGLQIRCAGPRARAPRRRDVRSTRHAPSASGPASTTSC